LDGHRDGHRRDTQRTGPDRRPGDGFRAQEQALRATALPETILRMQRSAGNAAVARAIAPRAIQRCGAGCGCASCGHEDEDLLERRGAGLLRSAVERRSA